MNNVKKYLIGFIIGLSLIGSVGYAANYGSIGSLFTIVDGKVKGLPGSSIMTGSIYLTKLDTITQVKINNIPTVLNDLIDTKIDGKNIFLGAGAGINNTTGINNVSQGIYSLNSNTEGNNNTANGFNSLKNNTTGMMNTADGSNSLKNNTTGYVNTANGYQSLYSNTIGKVNTAIGINSLYSNTIGYNNTAIGGDSLRGNTEGYNNTSIGFKSLYLNDTGTGNVGIGSYAGFSSTGSNKLYIDNSDTDKPLIYGDFSKDEVTINDTLYVVGDVTAEAYNYNSDIRYKKEIKKLEGSLEKILKLNGYSYTFKKSGKKDIGIIAQEVEKIFPRLVNINKDGYKSVQYGNLVAPLIEAIKELNNKNDILESRISTLEKEINILINNK